MEKSRVVEADSRHAALSVLSVCDTVSRASEIRNYRVTIIRLTFIDSHDGERFLVAWCIFANYLVLV